MKRKTGDQIERNLREGFRKFGSEYASDYLANTAGSMIYNTRSFEAQDSDEAQNLADVPGTDDPDSRQDSRTAGFTRPTGPAASVGYGTRRRKENAAKMRKWGTTEDSGR